jgi:hypothetical protein
MADRKPFLLRVDRDLLIEIQRWADDDLRSLNGQIEFPASSRVEGCRAGRIDLDQAGESQAGIELRRR